MTGDLPDRLRRLRRHTVKRDDHELLTEAADEIESLRAENERLRDVVERATISNYWLQDPPTEDPS